MAFKASEITFGKKKKKTASTSVNSWCYIIKYNW